MVLVVQPASPHADFFAVVGYTLKVMVKPGVSNANCDYQLINAINRKMRLIGHSNANAINRKCDYQMQLIALQMSIN